VDIEIEFYSNIKYFCIRIQGNLFEKCHRLFTSQDQDGKIKF